MNFLQARLTPDVQNFQSGSYVNWTLSNGTVAPATNTTGRPLQFSVNLQNQTVPTFLTGPDFTAVTVCQLPAALSAVYIPTVTCMTTCHTQTSSPRCCQKMQSCGSACSCESCLPFWPQPLVFHACGMIVLTSNFGILRLGWIACLPCQAELAPCEQHSSPAWTSGCS